MSTPSKIFTGYRALGYVSNHVPLAVRYHNKHKENYVITCVGRAFHTYNCSRLGIISISDSHPDAISCLCVDAWYVFTACCNVIRAFKRGKQVIHIYKGHENDVHLLLPFGKHLVSVDDQSNLKIWDIEAEELYMEMEFENASFHITAVCHPSTYVNKILLGSKQGHLQLWNVKTSKLLYTITGWSLSVTVLEQAPALDVIGIGLADGHIHLHNIRFDETVMSFMQDWGPVTTLAFRTDGHPIMVSGSAVGHIALWNLEERRLKSQIRDAHTSSISGMQCLPSEPLLVTSSADNSLKIWIFDLPDGGGRLLRQRSGHSAPPNKLRHYGNTGKDILSAGQDSTLRLFSTIHESHDVSLGRASFRKKQSKHLGLKKDTFMMPPITDFAAEISRASDWDNIVSTHRGIGTVTTWSSNRKTMGQHKLGHDRFSKDEELKDTTATAVCVSSCGNFALTGYSTGHVDMYNLQSGLHRGAYGDPKAHDSSVRGLATDALNQLTISAGASGEIKFWKFKKKTLLEAVKLHTYVSQIVLHREGSMLAVGLDDFTISVIDISTRRVVRMFAGHHSRLTDMGFSADARWLITSGMDATLKIWDMPTGKLIDCFLVDSAVTSLTMSPTSDFLATSHVDDLGIYLWSNMGLYKHISLNPLPDDFEPSLLRMSGASKEITALSDDEGIEPDEASDSLFSEYKSPEQISNELVTLSLLPTSRWLNLLDLDIIRQRNKPKAPPKKPKSAPFFLPTIPGLEPKFSPAPSASEDRQTNRQFGAGYLQSLTVIGKKLDESQSSEQFLSVLEDFKKLGPSSIDIEIRSLSPEGGGSVHLMVQFLCFISHILDTKANFELAESYLGLFLQLHGDIISSESDLILELEKLNEKHSSSWQHLQNMFNQGLCLVNYLRNAVL